MTKKFGRDANQGLGTQGVAEFIFGLEDDEVLTPADFAKPEGFFSLGSCMEPTLMPGDRLRVQEVAAVEVGWIVAFRWGPDVLVHRVVRVAGGSFWASGDSSLETQGPVLPGALIGRVVAFRRDGEWRSIEGLRWELKGLWYGSVVKSLRRLDRRKPGLRSWFEGEVLGNPLARRVLSPLMGVLLGRVDYSEEQDWQRAVAFLGSGDFRLSQDLLTWVREGREAGEIRVWVANSSRLGRIGRLSVCKLDTDDGVSTALIFSHSLRPLVRGVGIGSKLLLAAEGQAVLDGYRRVVRVVSENNLRSLSVDQEHYRIVQKDELGDWPEDVLRSMRPDHMLLVKNLDDMRDEER